VNHVYHDPVPWKLVLATALFAILLIQVSNVYGLATFALRIGGPGSDDVWRSIEKSSDGGYIIAGSTDSAGAGKNDVWIIKISEEGTIEWQRTYGGQGGDSARTIKSTPDGGFVVAGQTNSFSNGRADMWVLKFNSAGVMEWHTAYGGPGNDIAHAIEVTSDGGYLVAGYTSGFGAVLKDYFVIKIGSAGEKQWAKRFGGTGDDVVRVVKETSGGEYLVAGFTHSFGLKGDVLVVKLAEDGQLIWQKRYGGAKFEEPSTILEVPGGYIILEQSASFSNTDGWMFKIDDAGKILWQKRIGGGSFDELSAARLTPDGGFLVAAETKSFGAVNADFWVVKFDSSGEPQWQKRYGGPGVDEPEAIALTPEGGSLVVGTTRSFGAIGKDVWFLRLNANGDVAQCSEGVTHNLVTNAITRQTVSTDSTTTAADVTLTTSVKSKPGTVLSGKEANIGFEFQCGVDVINRPPIAEDDEYEMNEDDILVQGAPGVLANDSDPDGNSLTVEVGTSTDPSNGDLILNADGSFEYRPDDDFYGTDSFTYQASDGTALSNFATVTITVNGVDDAPVAVDDSASTPKDTPIDIAKAALVSNDIDVDGDALSVLQFDSDSTEGGTIVEVDEDTLRYTPKAGFAGSDSFDYTVSDGTQQDTGTVYINVGAPT
jgi:VCBS repeat-containing protein